MKLPVPKYHLVKSLLQSRLNRDYVPGNRIPSEFMLCRTFGVSRTTIQQALSLLEREGLVRREQGRGTFYLGEGKRRMEAPLSGLLETVIRFREGSYARVISKGTVPAVPYVAERLHLEPHSAVVNIQRVGLIDGEPIMFISAWLPSHVGAPLLEDDDLLEKKAIGSILQEKYKIDVGRVQQTIGASLADPTLSEPLKIDVGAPVLEVERTYYDTGGRPLAFAAVTCRSDRYRFEVTMESWR